MRILRLVASDEAPGRLPVGTSIPEIIASLVEAETGESVEITLRSAWPSAALPGLIDKWLDEYEPDVVFLKVNAFWFNYLSLPLQIERKFGKFGKPINRVGKQVGELRPVSSSRPYRIARRYLLRAVPWGHVLRS